MKAPYIFYGMCSYLQCPCAHALAFSETLGEGLAMLNSHNGPRESYYFSVFALTESDQVIHIRFGAEGWVAS